MRAYSIGGVSWTRSQVLDAWTMKHGRRWNNLWSEIVGREVPGSTRDDSGGVNRPGAPGGE